MTEYEVPADPLKKNRRIDISDPAIYLERAYAKKRDNEENYREMMYEPTESEESVSSRSQSLLEKMSQNSVSKQQLQNGLYNSPYRPHQKTNVLASGAGLDPTLDTHISYSEII